MNNQEQYDLGQLILLSLEGKLSADQFEQLRQNVQNDPDAMSYYMDYVVLYSNLLSPEIAAQDESNSILDDNLWLSLAEEERTAPAVEIPKENSVPELIQKVVYPPREKRHLSKFNIFSLVAIAAMALFLIYLHFSPQQPSSIEVATIIDQMNVQWGQPNVTLSKGDRLWTNEGYWELKKGMVQIQYDDGVEVLIEGPAVFEIERKGLYFEYGRLYSRVSDTGLGFTVMTPTSQFIDLGTEFGMLADINGSSELHVVKGKVQLIAGSKGASKTGQIIGENKAIRYNAYTSQVKNIPVEERAFVRRVHSETGTIWRGQKALDLADIVGGGNGLGTGQLYTGIDPSTGKLHKMSNRGWRREGTDKCALVSESLFVDAVFIPNQNQEGFPISSSGLSFKDFKTTNGKAWCEICNGVKDFNFGGKSVETLTLNGLEYGTGQKSIIMFHANAGITFDLDMIRESLPELDIMEFKTVLGIPDFNSNHSNVTTLLDAYVLLDGQELFRQEKINSGSKNISIKVPIRSDQRFLTLALTDSGNGNHVDYAVFAEPVLILQGAE